MVEIRGQTDVAVDAIREALEQFGLEHPAARLSVYRYNSGSIRLRIISDAFDSMSEAQRHDFVWPFIEPLDEDVVAQISIMVLLTPKEEAAKDSIMNIEFEYPTRSEL
jgi:acid stress-induced BolA-like protein IbaG/YrbA